VFQIGNDPDRIDFLTAVDGLLFETAWQSRENHQIDGVTVPVLSVPDLLKNKKSAGRPKTCSTLRGLRRSTDRTEWGGRPVQMQQT
jgi:hypothetical protein